jgi:leader peptidase (prepilin peptidase)/N-methyltransferase
MHSVFLIPVTAATLLGLLLGSFLNVCIVRLPAGESILQPGSRCRQCMVPIRAFDNIPLVSWVWLRGRCRRCRQPIPFQYPLVEATTALLFAACIVHAGANGQAVLDGVACFFLLGLAIMDAQTMLLPDAFTLGGLAAAVALKMAMPGPLDRWQAAWRTLADAAVAAAILLGISLAYRLIRHRAGVGLGDVKLLAMMGALLGLPLTLIASFLGVIAAAAYALFLIRRRNRGGFDRLPFGAFLASAGIFAIFFGQPLLRWYLGLFQP